jgi:hypothetical protein
VIGVKVGEQHPVDPWDARRGDGLGDADERADPVPHDGIGQQSHAIQIDERRCVPEPCDGGA